MDQILLRQSSIESAPSLSDFGAKTFKEAYVGMMNEQDLDIYINKSFTLAGLRQELAQTKTAFFTAERSGQILGYCKVRMTRHPECVPGRNPAEFVRSYVLKSAQKNGLGRKFFEVRREWARAQGADGLWLSVWDENASGISFHKKMGFSEVGEEPFQVGTQLQRDIIMYQPLL